MSRDMGTVEIPLSSRYAWENLPPRPVLGSQDKWTCI